MKKGVVFILLLILVAVGCTITTKNMPDSWWYTTSDPNAHKIGPPAHETNGISPEAEDFLRKTATEEIP